MKRRRKEKKQEDHKDKKEIHGIFRWEDIVGKLVHPKQRTLVKSLKMMR